MERGAQAPVTQVLQANKRRIALLRLKARRLA
jgi:hypothetical protein